MCDWCEDWAAREPRAPGTPAEVTAQARLLERAMPGTPVADAAWRIALGQESGAIAWADQARILAALQQAAALPAPFAKAKRRGEFRCALAG
jgi:hypothetical protein